MINQANPVIKASRRQDGGPGHRGNGLQGFGIDELEVVDGEVGRSLFEEEAPGGLEIDGGILLTGDAEVPSSAEGTLDAGGIGSLRSGESGISGGKGEAVIFADGRVTDDLDRHVEVPDHAMNEGELLEVLFTKDREVGLEDIKELQDNGEDAVKVSRSGLSAKVFGEEGFRDENRVIGLVESLFFGDEGDIDTLGFAQGKVIFQGPGIIGEVCRAVELDGVDEDRDHDGSCWPHVFSGGAEEFEVAFVQGSHGGNEGEWAWHFLQRGPYRVDVSDTCDHLSECQ